MGKINFSRAIIAGLVAGIVGDLLGFLVNGLLLAPQWADGMRALGHGDFSSNEWIWFNLLGLVSGIVTIWIYAAIRPRFGTRVKTAVYAGVAVWILSVLIPNVSFMGVAGLFPPQLIVMTTAGGLVEVIGGAIAGAAIYKELARRANPLQVDRYRGVQARQQTSLHGHFIASQR